MARSFNGSSDAITASPGASINGATTLAVAFWLKWTTFANTDNLAMEYSVNYNSNAGAFILDPNGSTGGGGGFFEVGINVASVASLRYFTRPSSAVFHNYVFNYNASASGAVLQIPSVYVDGVSQSLTTQFSTTNTGTFGNFSLYFMSRAAASLFGAGSMADAAIYNVNLTAGEASALANGARPYTVRPNSLLAYWPDDGLQSPEPDLSGLAHNGTLTGTALAAGPPVAPFTPRWHRFLGWTPALPAAGLGWIINRRNKLMVPKKRA